MAKSDKTTETSVFYYNNFRDFLKCRVRDLKNLRPDFTMRTCAAQIGFKSPSFLKMIMDGKRRLTDDFLSPLCETLEIDGKEKDYFILLVHYTQCEDPDAKRNLLNQINNARPRAIFSTMTKNQMKYLSEDHYAYVREMVLLKDFREDAKWIAARCFPRIKPDQARDAVQTLLDLGLLLRSPDGKLVQSENIVDTGENPLEVETFGFHEAVLNKARHYLSLAPQEKRNFTTLTIPAAESLVPHINKRIRELQDEILDLVNQQNLTHDQVYQLNVQFFPVTQDVTAKPTSGGENHEKKK